ncbi:hypothetical protein [Paenibacillus mesophilus]|nr:hypothetical protein [Paenibacillus mesophilus]
MRVVERETIRLLLEKKKVEPMDQAGELLGIVRATLFRKMEEYPV